MNDQSMSELEMFHSELLNKAQALLNKTKKRFGRSNNPVAPHMSEFLEREFNRIFLSGKEFTRAEEEVCIALLRVFSRNSFPHEEKRSYNLKTNGGVEVSCESRVHREEGDFFLIHSEGKAVHKDLKKFFAQEGIEIAGNDYNLVAKFLGEGSGKRAMVWTEQEGFILGVRQNEAGIQLLTSISGDGSYLIECPDPFDKIDHIIDSGNGLITAFIPVPREELNLQYSNK